MRPLAPALVTTALVVAASLALAPSWVQAQGIGLGGYGASMGISGEAGMGTGGPTLPYAGRFAGFMPYRMGGGDLSFQRRPSSAMAPVRPSFNLSSMSEGMPAPSGAAGGGMGPSPGLSASSFLQGGVGTGGRMRPSTPAGMGVMPPRIAYPFRQPPSLFEPSTGAAPGMSM
jgi:hypothetical protein